jgi:hypothetical protein
MHAAQLDAEHPEHLHHEGASVPCNPGRDDSTVLSQQCSAGVAWASKLKTQAATG